MNCVYYLYCGLWRKMLFGLQGFSKAVVPRVATLEVRYPGLIIHPCPPGPDQTQRRRNTANLLDQFSAFSGWNFVFLFSRFLKIHLTWSSPMWFILFPNKTLETLAVISPPPPPPTLPPTLSTFFFSLLVCCQKTTALAAGSNLKWDQFSQTPAGVFRD